VTTLNSPNAFDLTALREEFDIPTAYTRDEATERSNYFYFKTFEIKSLDFQPHRDNNRATEDGALHAGEHNSDIEAGRGRQ